MIQNNIFLSQNRPHREVAIFGGDVTQKQGVLTVSPLQNVAISGKLYIFLY